MIDPADGRWPPIYDAAGLEQTIRALIKSADFDARFWDLHERRDVCQGDIIALESAVPLIDEDGIAVAADDCLHWLVIGNTCDFARTIEECTWTQLVPLVTLGDEAAQKLNVLRSYNYSRRFYIPPWPGSDQVHRIADFTRPVPLHKHALEKGVGRVVARMQFPAWVLLHSCLVRFLARDDGRFDT